MAEKYILRVTAGSTYDLDAHTVVPVNQPTPVKISSPLMDVELNVRIQNYRGLPRESPCTSPYFAAPPHDYNRDQYSIAFRFTPKRPSASASPTDTNAKNEEDGISALDLQFGNDFDHPIRDRLPPGFGTALNIVRWWIDPGLEGDAYADAPYLYGPALSSFNAVRVGRGADDASRGGIWVDEGADDEAGAQQERKDTGAPDDAKRRMKWALREEHKRAWTWRWGREYSVDFYNPYIDFNEFALKLPGFTLPVIKYWDGQPLRAPKRSHQLRYVLRHRTTGQVYLVILFTLYLKEDVNADGSLKPAAVEATRKGHDDAPANEVAGQEGQTHGDKRDKQFDEEKVLEEARRKLEGVEMGKVEEVNGDDGGVD